MIVSLVASILLSIVASLGCLICASAWPRKHVVNRIDAWILPRLGKQISKRFGSHHPVRIARICFDLATCLSDQQMVTCIALLIVTLKKLHVDKTISVYHLTLVLCLIQASSTAYQFTLISQRSVIHLEEAHRKRDPENVIWTEKAKPWYRRLRDWMPWGSRMVLNHTLDVLFLYILWVTARSGWYYDARSPAHCVLKSYPSGGAGQTEMIFNYIIIISSDITQLIALFPAVEDFWSLYLRPRLVDARSLPTHYPSQFNPQGHQLSTEIPRPQVETGQSSGIGLILHWTGKFLKFIFATCWTMYCSTFSSAAVYIVWCIYYLCDTFDTKDWGQLTMEEQERQAEKEMGFGQIVPVFLLILLVLRVFDSLWGKLYDSLVTHSAYRHSLPWSVTLDTLASLN